LAGRAFPAPDFAGTGHFWDVPASDFIPAGFEAGSGLDDGSLALTTGADAILPTTPLAAVEPSLSILSIPGSPYENTEIVHRE